MPNVSVSKCRQRSPKMLIFGIASLFLSVKIIGATPLALDYEVRWRFVTLATIELNIMRSSDRNSISLSIKTKGPLKFVSGKEADVVSTIYRRGERTYELKTVDPKINEERLIRYQDGEAPVVVSFKELDTEKPLEASVELDGSSVDPVYVLASLLDRMESGQKCDGEFQIYDGKRRYSVTILGDFSQDSDSNQDSSSSKICRIVLRASSVELAKQREVGPSFEDLRSIFSNLLLKRKNQVLEITFDEDDDGNVYPLSFSLETPVGFIVARVQSSKKD